LEGVPPPILSDRTRELGQKLDSLDKRDYQNVSSLDFSACELARQITLLDQEFFQAIPVEELWVKNLDDPESAPNLYAFRKHNNSLTYWVCTEIASTPNLKNRIRTLAHHINVAEVLLQLNNWSSFMSFVFAFVSYPISRLKLTWKGLNPLTLEKWQRFEELTKPTANFGALRDACAKSQPPALPPISILLKDLIFIEDGNENWYDKEHKVLNFGKIELLGRIASMVKRAMDDRYVYSEVSVIKNYLLNLFYVDDFRLLDSFSKASESSDNNNVL